MGIIPLTAITEAKDGYQLSLVGLCMFILAIIWAVRYITEREKVAQTIGSQAFDGMWN